MVAESVKVGPNRYRESYGRYYEDFTIGDVYEHRPGRTINEADNTLFTTQTMNTQALHLDAAYAAETSFGERLVNSMFTLSTIVGLSVAQLTQGSNSIGQEHAAAGQDQGLFGGGEQARHAVQVGGIGGPCLFHG